MNRRPILTDRQLSLIDRYAGMLPDSQREHFLERIHARLVGEPSDAAVCHVINRALDLMVRDQG